MDDGITALLHGLTTNDHTELRESFPAIFSLAWREIIQEKFPRVIFGVPDGVHTARVMLEARTYRTIGNTLS
jgi:hypothetical protein